jgi:hypothetical protein
VALSSPSIKHRLKFPATNTDQSVGSLDKVHFLNTVSYFKWIGMFPDPDYHGQAAVFLQAGSKF